MVVDAAVVVVSAVDVLASVDGLFVWTFSSAMVVVENTKAFFGLYQFDLLPEWWNVLEIVVVPELITVMIPGVFWLAL